MSSRFGPGPVFVYECLTAARRWQTYALRCLVVGLLFIALTVVWINKVGARGELRISDLAVVGEAFFYALVGTQLTLILFVAPAATAGAVCVDKARGTLLHIFTTDLSNAEIVLGKLGSRLLPVLGLLGCSLPVMLLASLLGGVDPTALVGGYAVMLGVAVFGSALALVFSVWGKKAHEVLLAVYLLWALVLVAGPVWCGVAKVPFSPPWLRFANPYWTAFDAYTPAPTLEAWDYGLYLGVCLLLAILVAGVAVLRIRAVALHQAGQPPARRRAGAGRRFGWIGPTLDDNPVLWREYHRTRAVGWSWWLQVAFWIIAGGANLLIVFHLVGAVDFHGLPAWVNGLQAAFGLLFVTVRAVTSLTEERNRGSLDVLMTTPLTTASILWGKWRGAYRHVFPLVGLTAFTALLGSTDRQAGPGMAAAVVVALVIGSIFAYGGRHPLLWLVVAPASGGLVLLCLGQAALYFGMVVVFVYTYAAGVVSLGLATAVWIPRAGLALGVAVGAYVMMTAGSVIVVLMVGGREGGLMLASSFFAVGSATHGLSNGGIHDFWFWPAAALWPMAYLMAAGGFYSATLRTFHRCLGRVDAEAAPWGEVRVNPFALR